jgi:hypothetical protein
MKKATLSMVIEEALQAAREALAAQARDMVIQAAREVLAARVQAFLEEGGLTPAQAAPARAKAKAKAAQAPAQAQAVIETPAPVKARKREVRTKAQAAQALAQDDLETILQAAQAVLERYRGITTPRGKGLPEVLGRRLKNVLKHAQALGRQDLQALAQRTLALINADPRGTAMASWQALAARLGLPVPVAHGGEE